MRNQFEQMALGLRRTGSRKTGEILSSGVLLAYQFERRTHPADLRSNWYVTMDGKLWFGATFASRQNPGPGIRRAVALAGGATPTLEELEL